MAIAYHVHDFEVPTASDAEAQGLSISDKVITPSSLGAVLSAYVTSTALTTTLAGYVQSSAIGVTVQAYDADLAAIAALTSAANKLPYATGAGTWALADFTSAGRALLDDADAAAQRTTLGLGTAATTAATAYATAAQGATADTAIQPGSNRLVPAGGTTGQVLAKASATDYATTWTAAGVGDMLAVTYDPTNQARDIFAEFGGYETKWASKRDVNLAQAYPTDSYAQISWHAVASSTYSFRILRNSGLNGTTEIHQVGTGAVNFTTGGGELQKEGQKVIDEADIGVLVQAYSAKLAGIVANTRPRFSAAKSTQQTGVGNDKLTFSAEVFDIGGHYDTALSRWTPPAGTYKIGARVLLSSLTDQLAYVLSIYKNGAAWASNQIRASGASGESALVEDLVESNGTDYWEVFLTAGSGTANVEATYRYSAFYGYEV
ncbi:putative tail fiber protein [Microcystis phage Mae-JY35]